MVVHKIEVNEFDTGYQLHTHEKKNEKKKNKSKNWI